MQVPSGVTGGSSIASKRAAGYALGADETLSGVAPSGNLDRETWSLQLQVELLDKALSLSRVADAERVLGRIAVAVEERMTAGMTVDPAQLEGAFGGAVRLASAQGEVQWLRWLFSTCARLGRPPSGAIVSALLSLPAIFMSSAGKQLEDGDLALDKSLALFERGVELSRYCHDQLGAAQRRIEVLTERGELKDASSLAGKDDER